jgi:hypothetical protein
MLQKFCFLTSKFLPQKEEKEFSQGLKYTFSYMLTVCYELTRESNTLSQKIKGRIPNIMSHLRFDTEEIQIC